MTWIWGFPFIHISTDFTYATHQCRRGFTRPFLVEPCGGTNSPHLLVKTERKTWAESVLWQGVHPQKPKAFLENPGKFRSSVCTNARFKSFCNAWQHGFFELLQISGSWHLESTHHHGKQPCFGILIPCFRMGD